jgi:ankyrin repeat protein
MLTAIREGSLRCLQVIVDHIASTKLPHLTGDEAHAAVLREEPSAVHVAAEHGQREILRYLVQTGADVNLRVAATCRQGAADEAALPAARGTRAVHLAVQHGHLEVLQDLVDYGADLFAMDADESTCVHLAAGRGDAQAYAWCRDAMIAQGSFAPLEAFSGQGYLPLHLAASNGNSALLEAICDDMAAQVVGSSLLDEPCRARGRGCTALALAILSAHDKAVATLLRSGASVNALSNPSHASLAIQVGSASVLRELLAAGLRFGAEVNETWPLHRCAAAGHVDCLETLGNHFRQSGSETPFDEVDDGGFTPLLAAAAQAQTSVVLWLLERENVDLAARDALGRTADQVAACHGHVRLSDIIKRRSLRVSTSLDTGGAAAATTAAQATVAASTSTLVAPHPMAALKVRFGPGTICSSSGPIQPSQRRACRSIVSVNPDGSTPSDCDSDVD